MGPEGAVNIIGRSAIEASDDPEKTREEMLAAVKKQIDPYLAARNDLIDDVIDPRETRPTVIRGLRMAKDKRVQRPWKKHGVMPV
jgi:acetyl-CoA carboxylase carboxyltransferase component